MKLETKILETDWENKQLTYGRWTILDCPRAGSQLASFPGNGADLSCWRWKCASLTSLSGSNSAKPCRESPEGVIIPGACLTGVTMREEQQGGARSLLVSYLEAKNKLVVGCLFNIMRDWFVSEFGGEQRVIQTRIVMVLKEVEVSEGRKGLTTIRNGRQWDWRIGMMLTL